MEEPPISWRADQILGDILFQSQEDRLALLEALVVRLSEAEVIALRRFTSMRSPELSNAAEIEPLRNLQKSALEDRP